MLCYGSFIHFLIKIHFRSNTCETAENTIPETQQKKVVKPIDVSFFLYQPPLNFVCGQVYYLHFVRPSACLFVCFND